jgi:phospholipid/cholesterol/gamma-HCH transport system substrate-binding protein
MNQTFQSIRVGVFFALGLALIYIVYTVIGSNKLGQAEGYTIVAEFDDIRTLSAGAEVRMAGVHIGEVSKTGLIDGRGQAILQIADDIRIPADSVARISMASLLGQNYLSVEYGPSADSLQDGDQILTEAGADFNDILADIKSLGEKLDGIADSFSGFGGEGMGELFTNLNALVTDNRERFDTVMANLEDITGELNSTDGTLGKLINDDQMYEEILTVVTEMKSVQEDMDYALGSARELIEQVKAGEGTLGRLLVDDTIALELEETIANMREFSEKLNSGEGTLGKLVTDDTLYVELRSMLNKADTALDSLGDSGPITAVGAVSGALF